MFNRSREPHRKFVPPPSQYTVDDQAKVEEIAYLRHSVEENEQRRVRLLEQEKLLRIKLRLEPERRAVTELKQRMAVYNAQLEEIQQTIQAITAENIDHLAKVTKVAASLSDAVSTEDLYGLGS